MKDASDRKKLVSDEFNRRFGHQPAFITRAPGRVDLMGSHTDYNDGYVMTMSLDRDTWLAARPRADRRVSIQSMNLTGSGSFSLENIQPDGDVTWTNYVRGMALALQEAGHSLCGFDGLVHSTVPFNSGLSSSAAIEMATAVAFSLASDFEIDAVQMALLGQQAENRFVGVNSGILDQYSSALGQAGCSLLLDCRALTHQAISIDSTVRIVICDTRAERNLTGTEYDERRAQCEQGVGLLRQFFPEIIALRDVSLPQFEVHQTRLPQVVARRCRFIIEENQRVLDLAAALPTGNRAALHDLCLASYTGARDLYEIGAPAMKHMMNAMQTAPGVIGARQAGAGFGGCMVALVEASQVGEFQQAVEQHYLASTGINPSVYPVKASAGAGPLVM